MPDKITFDPSQPIEIYFRVNRNGVVKKFIFTNEDGSAHSISGYNFELFAKQNEQSEDKVFSLTVSNGGLEISGAGTNELDVILTTSHSNVRARKYYGELYAQADEITWFNIDLFAHKGKFDGVTETTGVTVQLEGNNVNITVAAGGSSLTLGETSTTAYRGDRGKTAYDHSQSTGNPHGTIPSDITGFNAAALAAAPAETTTTGGALINGATAKNTPVDADFIGLMDSAASNILKKLSWANIKATLKTYFDTIYTTTTAVSTQITTALSGYLTAATAASTYETITNVAFKQNLVNAAVALVDGATIDLTAIKHTLATASSRTFTISYTGDDITLEITLSATSATFTLPTGDKGIYNGVPSGTNTLIVTGATSGDVILVAIKKIGTVHYWVGKNAIRS